MITAIGVENFKGIGDRVDVDLRPITLLFGANSAGKSSVIHSLHYAREILQRRNLNPDRTLAGEDTLDLGGFASFVHGHNLRRQICLSFDLDLTDESLPSYSQPRPRRGPMSDPEPLVGDVQSARVEFWIGWSELLDQAYVARYSVAINGQPFAQINFQPGAQGCELSMDVGHSVLLPMHDNETISEWLPIDWDEADETSQGFGLLWAWACSNHILTPTGGAPPAQFNASVGLPGQKDALPVFGQPLSISTDWDAVSQDSRLAIADLTEMIDYLVEELSQLVVGPAELLSKHLKQTRYLGPLREIPPRNYHPHRFKESHQWANGMAAWDLLLESESDLVEAVQTWLADADKLNVGYRVEPKQFRELSEQQVEALDAFVEQLSIDSDVETVKQLIAEQWQRSTRSSRLVLRDVENNVELEPQDVGVGVSQLVPVVVAVLDKHRGLTAVEQPELHLHPAVQVALGDLLIEGIRVTDRVLLVETHSEHLLLRLLRRIRETAERELPKPRLELKPDEVSVVFLEKVDDNVRTYPLRIDETGEFLDRWPKGFFAERAEELF